MAIVLKVRSVALERFRIAVIAVLAVLLTTPAASSVFVSSAVGAESTTTGSVTGFGDATPYGAPAGNELNAPVVGIASTPDGKGYWLVGADGGVFTYGDARFYGSEGGSVVMTPFVGIAPTPDGRGYWIAGDHGNVYNFGDAPNEGYLGVTPYAPVVGIAAVPSGNGYWLAAADGGVFSFGDAGFHGSMGGRTLNKPVAGVAATPDGKGYWLVAADGGVFSFGDAGFHGSLPGEDVTPNQPIVGIAATPDGKGYWLVAADGGVFSFGDAGFHGSMGASPPPRVTPATAIAASRNGGGYWLTTTDKRLPTATAVPSVLDECNEPTAPPALEPSTIVLACGDGNALLDNLVWSSWTSTTATATGYFTHNTCNPDCALGTFVSAPSTVRLIYPIETSVGQEFATISYEYETSSGSQTFAQVVATSQG